MWNKWVVEDKITIWLVMDLKNLNKRLFGNIMDKIKRMLLIMTI